MPPGRQPIITTLAAAEAAQRGLHLSATEVAQGRQAFVICPLVEESETLEAKSAVAGVRAAARRGLPAICGWGCCTGACARRRRTRVMRAFRDGEIGYPGLHLGGRGGHRRAQRHRDADRGRRPLRPGAAAPVPGPRGARRRSSPTALLSEEAAPRHRSGCAPWSRPPTASSWPRRTCGCAGPASSSACARAACPS